jgi:ABC-type transporter Mla subunit MlaD
MPPTTATPAPEPPEGTFNDHLTAARRFADQAERAINEVAEALRDANDQSSAARDDAGEARRHAEDAGGAIEGAEASLESLRATLTLLASNVDAMAEMMSSARAGDVALSATNPDELVNRLRSARETLAGGPIENEADPYYATPEGLALGVQTYAISARNQINCLQGEVDRLRSYEQALRPIIDFVQSLDRASRE